MQLSAVYEPVRQELAEVNEQFRLLVDSQKTTFPELYQMLSLVLIGGNIILIAGCKVAADGNGAL